MTEDEDFEKLIKDLQRKIEYGEDLKDLKNLPLLDKYRRRERL